MTVKVEVHGYSTFQVQANQFDTHEGELSLYRNGSRVAVFAPGEWLNAEIVEDEPVVEVHTPREWSRFGDIPADVPEVVDQDGDTWTRDSWGELVFRYRDGATHHCDGEDQHAPFTEVVE